MALLAVGISGAPAIGRAAGKAVQGVVNLNTAPPATLELLPGVGPAKVQSILEYRRKHPFRTTDELVRIKGIGHKMVKRLRPHLAVNGPTTAEAARGAQVEPPPPPAPERRPQLTCPPAPAGRPTARVPRQSPSRVFLTAADHCLPKP
ncbi:MAG TPA: helix-hairpin-helix domain-containing protein [Polyangia bacterium]|nr:helix-hairpin-helix domain-containing protein [Polyangia bacterium]